jgi:hypothetical protein
MVMCPAGTICIRTLATLSRSFNKLYSSHVVVHKAAYSHLQYPCQSVRTWPGTSSGLSLAKRSPKTSCYNNRIYCRTYGNAAYTFRASYDPLPHTVVSPVSLVPHCLSPLQSGLSRHSFRCLTCNDVSRLPPWANRLKLPLHPRANLLPRLPILNPNRFLRTPRCRRHFRDVGKGLG